MRVGVIFPGQGSQAVGMGADVAAHSPAAKSVFDRAGALLGYNLLELQSHGPDEKLRETMYSQPAIFASNYALYEAVEWLSPVVSAGHSFGEICSLTVAGAVSFENALRIVDERGKAMQFAAELAPGGMSAVIGLDAERIRAIVNDCNSQSGKNVQLANFNSPGQIVISGDLAGVQAAGETLLEAGAKRVVALNVSGAWHSKLMEPALERFGRAVDSVRFALPAFDVVSNVDAQPYRNVETIGEHLIRSITHEVRWHETALRLLTYELDLVVECGASPVLTPLMKRLPGAPEVVAVGDFASVEKLRARLQTANA